MYRVLSDVQHTAKSLYKETASIYQASRRVSTVNYGAKHSLRLCAR